MQKTTRLLILTHNYPRYPGDHAGVFISLLCRRLVDESIQPIVLAPHDPGAAEYEENGGVKIYRFRYGSDQEENLAYGGNMQTLVTSSLGGLLRFRRFVKKFRVAATEIIEKEKINVIAGHWLVPAGLVMKQLARDCALPMILSSHGTDIRLVKKFGGLPYRYLQSFCRSLNRWTFVSSYLRDQMLTLDPRLEDRLEVLPLPHDETIFHSDTDVVKEDALVAAVTRFTEQKRVDVLIEAFALVVKELPEARLELYGEGPLQPNIERLIESRGLSIGGSRPDSVGGRPPGLPPSVTIHRPVPQDELREVYNRASVVVLNSYREGFGLALSEAMLCGTAVVGVRSGGITDIIEHEQTGLLAEPDDPPALASALIRILKDTPLRTRLAASGHEFAHATYASGPLAARYAQLVHAAAASV
jgi:glycosyltransferase involved in cell wall biosynthesis